MELKLFERFLNSDSMWAILFCFLFLYFLKTNKDREKERTKEFKSFSKQMQEDMQLVHANMTFLVSTLKIILEKELKRRKSS